MEDKNINKNKEYLKIVLSLGYREIKINKFAKPVGKSLFTIELDNLLWSNWFESVNQQLLLFDSVNYDEQTHTNFLNFILECETYTRINIGTWSKEFQFLTREQQLNLML